MTILHNGVFIQFNKFDTVFFGYDKKNHSYLLYLEGRIFGRPIAEGDRYDREEKDHVIPMLVLRLQEALEREEKVFDLNREFLLVYEGIK